VIEYSGVKLLQVPTRRNRLFLLILVSINHISYLLIYSTDICEFSFTVMITVRHGKAYAVVRAMNAINWKCRFSETCSSGTLRLIFKKMVQLITVYIFIY